MINALHCKGLCYLSALILYSVLHVLQGAVMSLKVHNTNDDCHSTKCLFLHLSSFNVKVNRDVKGFVNIFSYNVFSQCGEGHRDCVCACVHTRCSSTIKPCVHVSSCHWRHCKFVLYLVLLLLLYGGVELGNSILML